MATYAVEVNVEANVWQAWITTTTSTTSGSFTMSAEQVWDAWNSTFTITAGTGTAVQYVPSGPLTEQQRADREQRQREYESRQALHRAQVAAQFERRQAAEARATELLEMVLTPDEWTEWQRDGQVTITAPSGRLYLVRGSGVHGNIYEVDVHGCRLRSGCVAPAMYDEQGALPSADGWVGQVLAIRHNEELLRGSANWSYPLECRRMGMVAA